MRISDWSSDVCSSDLSRAGAGRSSFAATQATRKTGDGDGGGSMTDGGAASRSAMTVQRPHFCNWRCHPFGGPWRRSEEHTSELQSLMRISYAVFCLKKKNKTIQETI